MLAKSVSERLSSVAARLGGRHSMRAFILCLPVMVAGTAISCADGTAPRPVPALVEIASGEAQEATVGSELSGPIVVHVLDGKGRMVEGQVVHFLVTSGGGTLSADSDVTDKDGFARDRWTLGNSTAENQSVEVRVIEESGGTPLVAVFHATPRADAPDTVRVVSGDGQSTVVHAAFADSLLTRVSDRFGNPVAGGIVAWSVSPDGGTLSQFSDTTTVTGYSSVKLTAGSVPGDQNVVATIAGRSATFTVHSTRAPLTINDLVGRHPLQSLRGATIPMSFFPASERLVGVLSGAVDVLPNGIFVLTEDYAITDFTTNYQAQYQGAIAAGVLTLKGDSLNLSNILQGDVSTAAITLDGYFDYGSGGPRVYARTPMATSLPSPGPGVSLAKVSGDGQQSPIHSTLPAPLVVRVLDAGGQPVAGQVVRFSVKSGGGWLTNGNADMEVTTDTVGLAQVQWTVQNSDVNKLLAIIVSSADGVLPSWGWFTETRTP